MARPDPRPSNPGPQSLSAPDSGLTGSGGARLQQGAVPRLLLRLAGRRHAQAAVARVKDNQVALARVHALADGARARQAHAKLGGCSAGAELLLALVTLEARRVSAEHEEAAALGLLLPQVAAEPHVSRAGPGRRRTQGHVGQFGLRGCRGASVSGVHS